MIIRSQDKKYLVNMGNISIHAMDREVICFDTSGIEDSGYISLGYYETEEKALKVLDMIQEAYSEYQIMLNFSVSYLHEFKEKTDGFAIFQMPEDSEVEV